MNNQFEKAMKLLKEAERLKLIHYIRVFSIIVVFTLLIVGVVSVSKGNNQLGFVFAIFAMGLSIINMGLNKYITEYIAYIDEEVKRQRKELNNHE